MNKRWVWVMAGLVAVGLAGWSTRSVLSRRVNHVRYRLATVDRGEIVQTVRATGTVQPIRVVDVGTQVNGPILKLNADYNDRVQAGQIVAQIDPTVYEARMAQDEANVLQSRASVEQARARLLQADKDLERARTLARKDMLSQSELDAATATRDVLAAQLKVAEASVAQAEASLRLSKANLEYTTIRSPVDGVVIACNASEGQTVVASMSAQVIFRIATDLSDMQVEASIPEADIGKIRPGQPVHFTVDAYDRSFTGTVWQVRLAAATVQNVVTYPVIIRARNPDGLLFPGMTANVSCEVARRSDALRVPNAALRFKPPDAARAATSREESSERRPRGRVERGAQVWLQPKPDSSLTPVPIQTGISDGTFTEVVSGPLKPGDSVAVGLLVGEQTGDGSVVNPFMPRFPGRSR